MSLGSNQIFASWSGESSQQVAIAFREWLPKVIQAVSVFVSKKDILAGERWDPSITGKLSQCNFGIVLVTKENKEKPWVMFEAGALSKNYGDSRVVPILCNLNPSEIQGNPLSRFQAVSIEPEGVKLLLKSINESLLTGKLSDAALEDAFSIRWEELKEKIALIQFDLSESKPVKVEKKTDAISSNLEELIKQVGNLNFIVREPSRLLPNKYLESVIKSASDITGELETLMSEKEVSSSSFAAISSIASSISASITTLGVRIEQNDVPQSLKTEFHPIIMQIQNEALTIMASASSRV